MKIEGIIGYPITPFTHNNENIDVPKLETVLDILLAADVNAIAALGSAGEAAYLRTQEWKDVAKRTVDYIAGKVPVIIGVAELTTAKAVEYAVHANTIGADAVMVSPFSYYKLSEDEIFDHYKAVSDAIDLPIMVYNNPAVCGVDMSPSFMLRMINEIDNVKMIKESTGDIQRMHEIYALSNGQVPFFNGCNHMALEALTAGAVGWCTAAPCLIGNLPGQLLEAVKRHDGAMAQDLFYRQYEFLRFIVTSGLAAALKTGYALKGQDMGGPRLPLKPLGADGRNQLNVLLSDLGVK